MLVELHILQNFAPSNLNRDDTGSPKDCEFGGVRRARISSQALKRAARQMFKNQGLLPEKDLAERTKRLISKKLAPQLQQYMGIDHVQAERLARAGLAALGGFSKNEDTSEAELSEKLTEYLFFIAPREVDALVEFCSLHSDALLKVFPDIFGENGSKVVSGRDAKKKAYTGLQKAVGKAEFDQLRKRHNGGKAADIALFGRMLADLPESNLDAAAQVAHAISTHGVSIEFDYYTAVDDLRPGDTQGADMIGTVEFNSACYYRYSNVDCRQLLTNLGDDRDLARATLAAYLQAAVRAIPTGKQNSFAAQQAPSFVMAVVRPAGTWSLANAFVKPVRGGSDLVAESVAALADCWKRTERMYGAAFAPAGAWLATMTDAETLGALARYDAGGVDAVVSGAVAAAFAGGASA